MRAAVVHEFHAPIAIEDVTLEDPRAGEVVVRIAASGVCRSDLHVLNGRTPVANLPMILGHEGAGVVEAVGPGVRGLAPGDPVVIGLYAACGECTGDSACGWCESSWICLSGDDSGPYSAVCPEWVYLSSSCP